jgi:hypothetical protein
MIWHLMIHIGAGYFAPAAFIWDSDGLLRTFYFSSIIQSISMIEYFMIVKSLREKGGYEQPKTIFAYKMIQIFIMKIVFYGAITMFTAYLVGTGSQTTNNFTNSDKENITHFWMADLASRKAINIINDPNIDKFLFKMEEMDNVHIGSPDKPLGKLVNQDYVDEILRYKREALLESRKVSDTVLDKIHSDFKFYFREKFQKHLEQFISFYKNKATSLEKLNKIESLFNEWGDFLDTNGADFKIPKGTKPEAYQIGIKELKGE